MVFFKRKKFRPGADLSAYKIWDMLKPELSDELLDGIARADGEFGYKENDAILRRIRKTGILPEYLEWEPHEVLSLVSWTESHTAPAEIYEVLFSCLVILAVTESEASALKLEGQAEKIIIAIDCAVKLGPDWVEALYEFFDILVPKLDMDILEEDWLYFKLGRFALSVLCGQDDEHNPYIPDVLTAEEDILRFVEPLAKNEDIMSYTYFDQRRKLWDFYLKKTDRFLQARRTWP